MTWYETGLKLLPSAISDDLLLASSATLIERTEDPLCDGIYDTSLGRLHALASEESTIRHILSEQRHAASYDNEIVAVRPGDIVLDVGSHVGTFTKDALAHGAARVIAFEPDPRSVRCFHLNLADEIDSRSVALIEAAVGDTTGTVGFDVNQRNTVMSRIDPSARLRVPLVTIDSTVHKLGLNRVDFVKIDIEGAEASALRGARDTLTKYRPQLAVASYHHEGDMDEIRDVVTEMVPDYAVADNGYIQYFKITQPLSVETQQD